MSGPVAAILLAAGRSQRMGACKQLLPLGGSSVIDRCLATLHAAGVGDIVTVVSPQGVEVAEAARLRGAVVAVNDRPDGDMASSVRCGHASLARGVRGVVVALCDYPLVRPETVARLAAAHAAQPDLIVIPRHLGRIGHPLLVPRTILDELTEGVTLRDLVRRDAARVLVLNLDDPGILIDMDTPEDYDRVCRILEGDRQGVVYAVPTELP